MTRIASLLVATTLAACATPGAADLSEILPPARDLDTYGVLAASPDFDARVIAQRDAEAGTETRIMQTRIRELRGGESDRRVWLVSLVHLADRSYWDAVERVLRPAGVVFVEGVVAAEGDEREKGRELVYMMRYRAAYAALTGWVMQSQWMEMATEFPWKLADITLEEFRALGSDQIEPARAAEWEVYFGKLDRLVTGETVDGATRESVREPMKQRWIIDLQNSIREDRTGYSDRYGAAHDKRDRRLLVLLRAELKQSSRKPIVVIYGAAHTNGFVKALADDNVFETRPSRWIDAAAVGFPLAASR